MHYTVSGNFTALCLCWLWGTVEVYVTQHQPRCRVGNAKVAPRTWRSNKVYVVCAIHGTMYKVRRSFEGKECTWVGWSSHSFHFGMCFFQTNVQTNGRILVIGKTRHKETCSKLFEDRPLVTTRWYSSRSTQLPLKKGSRDSQVKSVVYLNGLNKCNRSKVIWKEETNRK